MVKSLKIALPVMLHADNEISAFKEAKERIEALGGKYGMPIDVGVFALYLPGRSRTQEAFQKQLENQQTHRLPIYLVETGVQQANALAYGPQDQTFNPNRLSDLEQTIDHVATLRDLDPTASNNLVVAPHVGTLVVDSLSKGDFTRPSIYSLQDFLSYRDQIYDAAKSRFNELASRASKLGLRLAIENTYSAVFENTGFWETRPKDAPPAFGMNYQVFQDHASLVDLSQGNLVLDLNHLMAMDNIHTRFKTNGFNPDVLFATLGINNWNEFESKAGSINDYLPHTRAFHLSSTDGIGIRVPKGSPEGVLWGDGTGPDLTSPEEYNLCIDHARENGLPVSIEVDYSFKPLTFREADEFLADRLIYYSADIIIL
jgi:hypothetical protein